MSDTPRTDAEAFFNPKGWTHNDRSVEVAPARFARTLERELADLRKIAEQAQEIERLKGCWAMACADGEKAQRELASKDAKIAELEKALKADAKIAELEKALKAIADERRNNELRVDLTPRQYASKVLRSGEEAGE